MSRMRILTSKVGVVLLSAAALVVVLLATRATWLTGSANGVAGPVAAQAPGTEAVTGLAAIALVGPAAAVAAVTAGRIARWIALAVMAIGAISTIGVSLRVVLEPDLVLGQVAARGSGGTGAFEATAELSPWPWVAVAGGALQLLAAAAGAVGGRRWQRLGGRYEAGADPDQVGGARGERVDSDWDRVGRGEEPAGEGGAPVRDE